jgi:hypothetical protein
MIIASRLGKKNITFNTSARRKNSNQEIRSGFSNDRILKENNGVR